MSCPRVHTERDPDIQAVARDHPTEESHAIAYLGRPVFGKPERGQQSHRGVPLRHSEWRSHRRDRDRRRRPAGPSPGAGRTLQSLARRRPVRSNGNSLLRGHRLPRATAPAGRNLGECRLGRRRAPVPRCHSLAATRRRETRPLPQERSAPPQSPRRGAPQAEANKLSLALQFRVGYFGGPYVEKIEDAISPVGRRAVEIGAGDWRVAAAEFGDEALDTIPVGLRRAQPPRIPLLGEGEAQLRALTNEWSGVPVRFHLSSAGSPCATLGGGINPDTPAVDLIPTGSRMQSDPESCREVDGF